MTFSVYTSTTPQALVLRIVDNRIEYLAPNHIEPLKTIRIEACFPFHLKGQQEEVFGEISEITPEHKLYPLAVKMYFQAQCLSHPETYTTQINQNRVRKISE